jgi:transcription elongation factor GreB
MSRAFVKEDVFEAVHELPDKPISPHPNYLTREGFEKLRTRFAAYQAKYAELSGREELAARQELAQVLRELRYLERRLQSAIVADPPPTTDQVHFGAWVEVQDLQGKRYTYRIVGEDEADASCGYISWVSPLAHALLGARVGEVVSWKRPAGEVELQIIAIRQ